MEFLKDQNMYYVGRQLKTLPNTIVLKMAKVELITQFETTSRDSLDKGYNWLQNLHLSNTVINFVYLFPVLEIEQKSSW